MQQTRLPSAFFLVFQKISLLWNIRTAYRPVASYCQYAVSLLVVFISTFPSVACFRCRQRLLYRRERGKVFGLNTLCPQRKILPETARPPDLFTFNEVCTNFHGRRGDRRLRNCHWLSWPECVRCLLLFSISLSISFEILSSVILAYPWVVVIFECPIILAMLSIDTLSEMRRTPNP